MIAESGSLPSRTVGGRLLRRSSYRHGPPSLGRVHFAQRSPASTLLCSPPTPLPPSAAAPVPLARGLPRLGRFFLAAPCVHPRTRGASEIGLRVSVRLPGVPPRRDRGLPGYLAVLFARAAVHDPAGCVASLPDEGDDAAAFRTVENPGHPGLPFRGCATRGSGRSRTYASTAMLPPPQQGSLPAWRAHLWPDGACTRRTAPEFHGVIAYSPPFGPGLAWSHLHMGSDTMLT